MAQKSPKITQINSMLLNCLPDPRGALQAGPDDVAGVAVEGELVEVVDCELRHSDDPRRTEVAIYFMFG